MNRRHNWPLVFGTALTAGLYMVLSRGAVGTALALAGVAVAFVIRPVKVDDIGQIIVALFALASAYVSVMVIGAPERDPILGTIGPVGSTAALAFLLAGVVRLFVDAPRGGDPLTAGAVFVAILSMGALPHGYLYPAVAVSVFVLLLVSCRYRDPTRSPVRLLNRRYRRLGPLVGAVAAVVFFGLVTLLPAAYRRAFERLEAAYLESRTGFSQSIHLGGLRDMLQSDEVVMRVAGDKPDYLRGIVYTRYIRGNWLAPKEGAIVVRTLEGTPGLPHRTEVTIVGGERNRYFLPSDAVSIAVDNGQGAVSREGIVMPPVDHPARVARFRMDPGGVPLSKGPGADAVSVPRSLEVELRSIANDWTRDAEEPEAKLLAIERHLRETFEYSLELEQTGDRDPVLDFLTTRRKGHCEYFASAMTLLARTLGIPTRVVGGYTVHERNPIGGYHVVRERNAHAWVEAWLPETGWRTFDPTPTLEVMAGQPDESPIFAAMVDVAAVKIGRFYNWVTDRTAGEIAAAVAAMLLLWVGLRLVRRLRQKQHDTVGVTARYTDPLPAVERLIAHLRGLGESRRPGEPLDRFAHRVVASGRLGSGAVGLADLVAEYTTWRFGNSGDGRSIAEKIEHWMATSKN